MNRNTTTIAGLLILVAAYGLHQRGLFVVYHLFKAASMMLHH